MHVIGSEGFSGQVCAPVLELVMIRCDEAAPLAIEGVANGKFGVAEITVFGEVWGALGRITGRGHHTIPAPPALSHSPYTAAPSSKSRYLSPVAVNMRLVLGPLRW